MKILAVATKSPLPPVDGGRLLTWNTLSALCAAGHEIDLIAPGSGHRTGDSKHEIPPGLSLFEVAVRRRSTLGSLLRAAASSRPVSIARHSHAAISRAVEERVQAKSYDVIHVEQLQALDAVERARCPLPPIVLRAQNVESQLWAGLSGERGLGGYLFGREARRLRRWEGAAVARADITVALTETDAEILGEFAGGRGRVATIPAPFPSVLPPAENDLAGEPAVVYLGSAGWLPNREGWRWFADQVWPEVHVRLPGAVLHIFQRDATRAPIAAAVWHEPPAESREAFASGSVLVVPLRAASGVRIRILEAWARGVPVIATPAAARGLRVTAGTELQLATTGEEFAGALERLAEVPGLAESFVAAGRRRLAADHAAAQIAEAWSSVYEEVAESTGKWSGTKGPD